MSGPRPNPFSKPDRRDLQGGGWIEFWRWLITGDEWLARLRDELPLAVESYVIHGRPVASPRLVSWHGDPDSGYAYSGVFHEPAPWTPALAEIREVVQETTGLQFNSVLANLYRDGADHMGWHADKEPEIGPTPEDRWIASISLGEERRFLIRHRRDASEQYEYLLGGGSLLVMRGTTQDLYRHSAPKTRRPVGPRLNLTFRVIVPAKPAR